MAENLNTSKGVLNQINALHRHCEEFGFPLELLWHPEGGWAVTVADYTVHGDTLEEAVERAVVAASRRLR